MRVVIVYESQFGDTREVAEAIGDGVRQARPEAEVECLRVGDAAPERVGSADVLVVGGPTHMRGMTFGRSRKLGLAAERKKAEQGGAAHRPDPGAEGPGVREWFHTLPQAHDGVHAAAFDTRVEGRMAGGAARGISRRLRGHGYEVVADPAGFLVQDAAGPLREGELTRAREWGAALR